jgi:predicted deacylase
MPERAHWSSRRLAVAPDARVGVEVFELDSGARGPHLLVLGGVHGDEVGGIVAAGRLAAVQWPLRCGRLTVVPVAHEAAHLSDARVSPVDGGNLARSFPGAIGRTETEELAWLITHRLIATADVLIDLHTSNFTTDMPLFVGCVDDGSVHATQAVELAFGFGLPLLWTHPAVGPGRTLTVALDRGIPALYVESPVGGVLNPVFIDAYIDGVGSVMESLGMLAPGAPRPEPALWLHGNGDVDTFSAAEVGGLFEPAAALMQSVRRGQAVGTIIDSLGNTLSAVAAPADGYVTTLRRSARVAAGEPLVGITKPRVHHLGLPSDHITSRSRSIQNE